MPRHARERTYYLLTGRYAVRRRTPSRPMDSSVKNRSPAQEQSLFLGVHAHGTVRETVAYWVELAQVRGQEGARTLRGYGVDLGLTSHVPLPWHPALTASVAFGSGDTEPTGRLDRSFRQTGTARQRGHLGRGRKVQILWGAARSRAEQSLHSLRGIGLRPTRTSSLDLVAHAYWQHTAAAQLRDTRLDIAPLGHSRTLGQAFELIVGYAPRRHVKARWIVSVFVPGSAFPADAALACFTKVEVEYRLGHR